MNIKKQFKVRPILYKEEFVRTRMFKKPWLNLYYSFQWKKGTHTCYSHLLSLTVHSNRHWWLDYKGESLFAKIVNEKIWHDTAHLAQE